MPKDPDILVDLTTARTAFEAEMIAESLRAQGIGAEAFTTVGSMLQWDIAATQPMRVQVRRKDLARAREVLLRTRAEAKEIDWSDAPASVLMARSDDPVEKCLGCGYDVSTLPEAEVCPECGTFLVFEPDAKEGDIAVEPAVRRQQQAQPVRWRTVALFLILAPITPVVLAVLLDLAFGVSWQTFLYGGYAVLGVLVAIGLVLVVVLGRRALRGPRS